MINLKKISIIALILIGIGVAGCLLTFRAVDKGVAIHEEKTFDSSKITEVEISSDNSHVEVVPTKGAEAKVEVSGKGPKDMKKEFLAAVEGNALIVKWRGEHKGFIDFPIMTESLTIKVTLPEKQYKSMMIHTDNGEIQAAGLNADQLTADTNNGRIELKEIASKNVEVEADNGKLMLDHVSGKIKGKTNNGQINVKTIDLERSIQLETDNGRIEIVTEKEPENVAFDVHVDNGRVNILDKYEGNAVIGDGDHVIKLKTNNGKISVTK